ncbi:MAG TPA: adenylosuccinate synthetase [Candidatus Bilamarchaeaceae archaeon]|nr:adenylosuccinate synthetase [Candidatus Bilamarchaeaceae archaeon]
MRTILVGGQFGDEGKGKIASYLAVSDSPEIVARGGVGPNAGHTVQFDGKKYGLRMLPCGINNPKSRIMIGAGVVVDPGVLEKEVELTGTRGRVFVDRRCTVITAEHKEADAAAALSAKIGTTKTGCGPAVASRAARNATLAQDEPLLEGFVTDVPAAVNRAKDVLVEGSQGFMLSVLYGTYPFVTSKDVSASSVAADVGLGPTSIDHVIMIIKSYTTRVGNGPFRDEIPVEEAEKLGFQEYGTVTGRPRRTSKGLHWEDLKFAAMVNGATQVAVTKMDVRFLGNAGVRDYAKLTSGAREFVEKIERELSVPVTLIGTGPDAKDIVDRRKELL